MTTPDIRWPRPAGELTLVLPTPELLTQVLEWRNRPDVTRWLIRTTVDPDAFVTAWLESVDDPQDHATLAVLNGRAVAFGSLEVVDGYGQRHEPAETWTGTEGRLGYLVEPAYAGRGFATAITRSLLGLAFEELGLRRVTASCFADNTASWRVMEKAGMRREAHAVREAWHGELGWVDGFDYAVLAEEWPR